MQLNSTEMFVRPRRAQSLSVASICSPLSPPLSSAATHTGATNIQGVLSPAPCHQPRRTHHPAAPMPGHNCPQLAFCSISVSSSSASLTLLGCVVVQAKQAETAGQGKEGHSQGS